MTSASTAQPARSPLRPRGMTVLYDAGCPVCRQARRWVERHRQLMPVRFIEAGSDEARRRFPELDVSSTLTSVTVVTDEGAVLRGERAWIAVLWALARTRRLAIGLAHGRGRWRLRRVQGAAESIRRWSASEPAIARRGQPWPAPRPETGASTCVDCQR